jgi:hypothetical protein
MSPGSQSDGHNAPGLIGEFIPGSAAMTDEIIVGFKDAIGEPVVAEKLPDVFDWIEFGAFLAAGR